MMPQAAAPEGQQDALPDAAAAAPAAGPSGPLREAAEASPEAASSQASPRSRAASEREGQSTEDRQDIAVTVTEDAQEPDPQRLRAKALLHQRRTSCTVLNKATGEYEYESIWKVKPRHMGHLGVGVQLYFQFIKQLGYVFLIMFVLSVPSLFFNASGSMVEDASALNQILGSLSIANLGRCPAAGCQSYLQIRERCAFTFPTPGFKRDEDACDLRVQDVAEWIGLLDGVAVLFFIAFSIYFAHVWIPRTVRKTDDANITPSDYTVWIPALPGYLQDAGDHSNYSERLKEHFQGVLAAAGRGAVADPDAVRSITLVHGFDGAIKKFEMKGKLLQEQDNAWALQRRASARGDEKAVARHLKRIAVLDGKITAIEKSLRAQARVTDSERRVCSAFVTFAHEEYKDCVLEEYRFASYTLFRLCQPQRLRFMGQRINVIEACEPTDLYWQNLDFSPKLRMIRQVVVVVLTLLVLVVCSAVVASLEAFSDKKGADLANPTWILANSPGSGTGCLELCDWQLFSSPQCSGALGLGSSARLFNAAGTIAEDFRLDGSCATSVKVCDTTGVNGTVAAWVGIEFSRPEAVLCMKLRQGDAAVAKEVRPHACAAGATPETDAALAGWNPSHSCKPMELVYPKSAAYSGSLGVVADASCATDPSEYIEYEVARQAKLAAAGNPVLDPTYNCYCKQQSRNNLAAFLAPPWDNPQEALCSDWSLNVAWTYGKVVGSVCAITLLNELLLFMYKYFIAWERLRTVTEVAKSQLWKLFLAQFVNTGLLILCINANIKDYPTILSFIKALSIGQGNYNDITGQWFTVVGTTLVLTVLIEVCTSVAKPLMIARVAQPLKRWLFSKSKVTQEALNDTYTLPEWNLSLRLAESMNIVFCVVMYSGGMPVLYAVGFLYCVLAYWTDKWCLLRASCRPPQYKEDVVRMAAMMLPLAAFLHTAVAGWAFGSQVLFPSEWSRLKPFAEQVFGITESEYTTITDAYRMGLADGVTMDFVKARFFDFARKGAWMLLVIFLASCVYYIVYYAWTLVLRPFLSPLAFLLKELVFRMARGCAAGCGWSLPGMGEATSMSWDRAVTEMRAKGITPSYRLADNKKYNAAYKALEHTAELVKSGTANSSGLPSPKRGRSSNSSPTASPRGKAEEGAPRKEEGGLNSIQAACVKQEQ